MSGRGDGGGSLRERLQAAAAAKAFVPGGGSTAVPSFAPSGAPTGPYSSAVPPEHAHALTRMMSDERAEVAAEMNVTGETVGIDATPWYPPDAMESGMGMTDIPLDHLEALEELLREEEEETEAELDIFGHGRRGKGEEGGGGLPSFLKRAPLRPEAAPFVPKSATVVPAPTIAPSPPSPPTAPVETTSAKREEGVDDLVLEGEDEDTPWFVSETAKAKLPTKVKAGGGDDGGEILFDDEEVPWEAESSKK